VVTEIKKKLIGNKIDTPIALQRNTLSKILIGIFIHLAMPKLSPCLRSNQIALWLLARDGITRSMSDWDKQASLP